MKEAKSLVCNNLGTRDTWGLGGGQDSGLGGAATWWFQVIDVSGEDSCIGLGDKVLGLIPGKRQHGGPGSLSGGGW
jgi:hypothetical protein